MVKMIFRGKWLRWGGEGIGDCGIAGLRDYGDGVMGMEVTRLREFARGSALSLPKCYGFGVQLSGVIFYP
jgi:hypothetical protein